VKKPQVIASARVGQKPDLEGLASFQGERPAVQEYLGEKATVNVRYSGTEPLVRVMIEAETGFSLEEVARQAVRLCRAVQDEVGSPGEWLEVKDAASGSRLDVEQIEMS